MFVANYIISMSVAHVIYNSWVNEVIDYGDYTIAFNSDRVEWLRILRAIIFAGARDANIQTILNESAFKIVIPLGDKTFVNCV